MATFSFDAKISNESDEVIHVIFEKQDGKNWAALQTNPLVPRAQARIHQEDTAWFMSRTTYNYRIHVFRDRGAGLVHARTLTFSHTTIHSGWPDGPNGTAKVDRMNQGIDSDDRMGMSPVLPKGKDGLYYATYGNHKDRCDVRFMFWYDPKGRPRTAASPARKKRLLTRAASPARKKRLLTRAASAAGKKRSFTRSASPVGRKRSPSRDHAPARRSRRA